VVSVALNPEILNHLLDGLIISVTDGKYASIRENGSRLLKLVVQKVKMDHQTKVLLNEKLNSLAGKESSAVVAQNLSETQRSLI
jgi:hypothetical protein